MNVLKGALAASIAVILWGFVFWWSPLPYQALQAIDDMNKIAVTRYLQAQFPDTGVYMVPSPTDYIDMLNEIRETGPAITVHVLANADVIPVSAMLVAGFTRVLVAMLLVGWLLQQALPALRPKYTSRVLLVVIIALAMLVYRDLADPIWWYYPWRWGLVKALHDLVAWTIAGLILAGLIHPSVPVARPSNRREIVGS